MEDPIKIIGVTEVCNQIADIYRKKMDAAEYNKQGELYNFEWTTEWNGQLFEVYFDLPEYWKRAEYDSRGVETGLPNRKGPPPYKAIEDWVSVKHLVPRTNGRVTRSGKIITPVQQMIEGIRWKIYWRGTKGKHLFEKTLDDPNLDKLVDNLVELITTQFEKEIEKEIQNIIK